MDLKISIITVSYNSEKTIEDTIKSVLMQKYDNYEHIIVDGNSKDGTMKIVKKYEKKYNGKLKYVSEKDNGIYDAMNKGIKMASGDVIGILNSDDVYASDEVLKLINENLNTNDFDGVHADLLYVSEDLKTPKRKWVAKSGTIKSGWLPAHPTLYLKKHVYDNHGLYDLNFRIVADYDFMVRICNNNIVKLKYIPKNFIYMRLGGVSSAGLKGYMRNVKEANKALKHNNIKFSELIILKRIFKTLIQMVQAKVMKQMD